MKRLILVAGLSLALMVPTAAGASESPSSGCGYGSRCVVTLPYAPAPTYRRCYRIWRPGVGIVRRACVFPPGLRAQ